MDWTAVDVRAVGVDFHAQIARTAQKLKILKVPERVSLGAGKASTEQQPAGEGAPPPPPAQTAAQTRKTKGKRTAAATV